RCARGRPARPAPRLGARARRRRAARGRLGAARRPRPDARRRRRRPGGGAAAGAAGMKVEEGVGLARHTTLRNGGRARAFAQPGSIEEVEELLRWARERGLTVATIGLGSNLLVADEGVDALVLKLSGSLAGVSSDGMLVRAGGGAANAVVLHHARNAGLG